MGCGQKFLRTVAARHSRCTTAFRGEASCARQKRFLEKDTYMSIESKDNFLALLDERIRRISKEVSAELVGQPGQSSDPLIEDIEAANIQKALQRIMVKEFISIREAHLLLCCSDGHIRNLVDKARKKKTSHPIPFLDLDGVTVFHRVKLLEWAEQPKQKLRAAS